LYKKEQLNNMTHARLTHHRPVKVSKSEEFTDAECRLVELEVSLR